MIEFDDSRVVVHVDLDCFYVQVERHFNRALEGKECAVVQYNPYMGGSIIALSYEAKAAGVKRSMKGDEAKKVCPGIELVTVPVKYEKADLSKYREAGSKVFLVCKRMADIVLRASIDEAYLDITKKTATLRKLLDLDSDIFLGRFRSSRIDDDYAQFNFLGMDMARRKNLLSTVRNDKELNLLCGAIIVAEIRRTVKKETGYTLSAGISHNKLLSKLVSGRHKPNKQTVLFRSQVRYELDHLPLKELNGLKAKFGKIVSQNLGVEFVGQISKFSLQELEEKLGEGQEWLYNTCRGICSEEVENRMCPKSVSSGKTFRGPTALKSLSEVYDYIGNLAMELSERIEEVKRNFRKRPTLLTVSISSKNFDRSKCSSFTEDCPEKIRERAFNLVLEIIGKGKTILETTKNCGITSIFVNSAKFITFRSGNTNVLSMLKSQKRQKRVHTKPLLVDLSKEGDNLKRNKKARSKKTCIQTFFPRKDDFKVCVEDGKEVILL
eukprot:augustus_masked-scaffold_13-processed-gene-7.55-mRNA-1 protein AED:0.06 eAED:0.06 QI:0/-1/0/1/-1/1/1/0/494